MSNDQREPSRTNFVLSALAICGALLLFILILAMGYLPDRPSPVAPGRAVPTGERAGLLQEKRAADERRLTTYGWIDEGEGVVRLPIDRAIELTLEEIHADREDNE